MSRDGANTQGTNRETRDGTHSQLAAIVVGCLLVVSAVGPVAAGTVPPSAASDRSSVDVATAPADPPTDRIGWENGRWYNESLDVTTDDGLTEAELEAVVARTMARVEHIRQVEFERTPPVKLVSREEQGDWAERALSAFNSSEARLLNVQYESLFMIGESTDAMESVEAFYAGGVAGFYDPEHRNITVVSPTSDPLEMNELTLAQELYHALQFEQFVDPYNTTFTADDNAGRLGIVEGDANYVEYLYRQRCDGAWEGTCLQPSSGGSGESGAPPTSTSACCRYSSSPTTPASTSSGTSTSPAAGRR